jgi:hypothetical protein
MKPKKLKLTPGHDIIFTEDTHFIYSHKTTLEGLTISPYLSTTSITLQQVNPKLGEIAKCIELKTIGQAPFGVRNCAIMSIKDKPNFVICPECDWRSYKILGLSIKDYSWLTLEMLGAYNPDDL